MIFLGFYHQGFYRLIERHVRVAHVILDMIFTPLLLLLRHEQSIMTDAYCIASAFRYGHFQFPRGGEWLYCYVKPASSYATCSTVRPITADHAAPNMIHLSLPQHLSRGYVSRAVMSSAGSHIGEWEPWN